MRTLSGNVPGTIRAYRFIRDGQPLALGPRGGLGAAGAHRAELAAALVLVGPNVGRIGANKAGAARLIGALAGGAAQLTVVLLVVLILLFPDGRLPSRRWRPVAWAIVVVAAGWATHDLQVGGTIGGGFTNALDAAKVSYRNPYGILRRTAGTAACSGRSSSSGSSLRCWSSLQYWCGGVAPAPSCASNWPGWAMWA